jgi:hypothetical protein
MIDGSQQTFAPTPHTPQAFPNTPRFSRKILKLIDEGGTVFGAGQFTHPTVLLMVLTTEIWPYVNAAFP